MSRFLMHLVLHLVLLASLAAFLWAGWSAFATPAPPPAAAYRPAVAAAVAPTSSAAAPEAQSPAVAAAPIAAPPVASAPVEPAEPTEPVAADPLSAAEPAPLSDEQLRQHEQHARMRGTMGMLGVKIPEPSPPPPDRPLPVDRQGVAQLTWEALAGTRLDGELAAFPPYLKDADGADAAIYGYMSPLFEAGQMHTFLLMKYPAGCPYCLNPLPWEIVFVELAGDETAAMSYDLVKLEGRLQLNRDDPEGFLFTLADALPMPIE